MNQALKIFFLFSLIAVLFGCNGDRIADKIPFVYRIDIPQGNMITEEQLAELEVGMTQQQVTFLLGTPLLVDPFHQDEWDYIYKFEPGSTKKREGEEPEEQLLRIYFVDNLVDHFTFFEKDGEEGDEKEVEIKVNKEGEEETEEENED
jgi:outer membrane protein assembly factor BamE (lipoprotein component of BamABCDE complex)